MTENILIIRQPMDKNEYEVMYDLRWRYLRRPLGQEKGSEKDDNEDCAIPFIAILNDQIVGTARFHKINKKVAQIKYFTVEKLYRNQGIGCNLLSSIHFTARNQKIKYIILNSPVSALNFFKKNGYEIVEKTKVNFNGINLFKMKKTLRIF
ncbi:MAG: GNAT family N-acetyltransferase [Candidatus Helarchaeota archaeon]